MKGLLAERLTALRKANGMTATQCAAELDVSIAAWSQWEKAKRDPSLKDLPKICWMFGVSMDNLFGLTDSCCRSGNNSVSVKNSPGAVAIGTGEKATVKTETNAPTCVKCPYKKKLQALEKVLSK